MVRSARKILSRISLMSSAMTHFPGVVFQQEKHPLHGWMFFWLTWMVSMAGGVAEAACIPSAKALASWRELLRVPFGLPLMMSMFTGFPPSGSVRCIAGSSGYTAACTVCRNRGSSASSGLPVHCRLYGAGWTGWRAQGFRGRGDTGPGAF